MIGNLPLCVEVMVFYAIFLPKSLLHRFLRMELHDVEESCWYLVVL